MSFSVNFFALEAQISIILKMLFVLLLLIATAATANLHWVDATRFDLDSVVNTIIAKIEPLQRKEC